ncbi:MAG: branched-chain amino acid ABC transporter permease [Rhodospirillales bacterium]|nr:branched-chain amino acid ABC transporter permease [Rhodospirillales bacterium]
MSSRLVLVLLVLAMAVVPLFVSSGYQLFQFTMVVAYALAVLGVNLVTGYNGQISLGHGAFYAIGAYVTAIMMDHWDLPYWSTLPVAAVICAGVGFLLGLPALRLGGLYLALTTLALAAAVPQLLKYDLFEGWTGGVQGISIIKPDAPFGLPLNADQWLYLFSFAVAVVLFISAWNLVNGRIGRALKAIRDQPLAAEAMGIDLAQLKTRTFAASAMYTGIAGSIAAIAVQFVSPDSFASALSITLFVGMVVGGAASISGAVFGALFIQFIPNIADQVSKAAPGAVYGLILIVFMFVAPGGIASLVRKWWPAGGSRARST